MKLSERGIIIRKTAEEDLRGIYLLSRSLPERESRVLTAPALAEIFMSKKYIACSAVRKKRVLGFIAGGVDNGKVHIERLIVDPIFRGSGIGSALLDYFCGSAKKEGADNFFIAVYEETPESTEFFLARGFSSSGKLLLMEKKG